jgi:hypothetical protein
MSLISASLHGTNPELPPDPIDWNRLYSLTKTNGVFTFLYPLLDRLHNEALTDELKQKWTNEALTSSLSQLQQVEMFYKHLGALHEEKVQFLLYKGIVIKEAYPYPELRMMSDIDILVHQQDFEKCIAVFLSLGYAVIETDHRVVAMGKSRCKPIEFHKPARLVSANGF